MAEITILDCDEGWPDEFQDIATELRAVLGDDALRIDHIGSTSVPGLAAKDVIDVQVTVADIDAGFLESALRDAGFVWRSDLTVDHRPPHSDVPASGLAKRVVTEIPGRRRANVHIRADGAYNQRFALLFRDYLRARRSAAEAYAEVKRSLAVLFPDDVDAYYAVKEPVFGIMITGAEDWAAVENWEPGPSDG